MRSSFLAQHGRVSLLGQSTLGTQSSCFHSKKRNDGRPERGNGLEVRREKYISSSDKARRARKLEPNPVLVSSLLNLGTHTELVK